MDILDQFFLFFQTDLKIVAAIFGCFFFLSFILSRFVSNNNESESVARIQQIKNQRKIFYSFFCENITYLEHLCLDLKDLADLIEEKIFFLYSLDRERFRYLRNLLNNDLVIAFDFIGNAIEAKARKNLKLLKEKKVKIFSRNCDYLVGSAFPKMNQSFSDAVEDFHSYCENLIDDLDVIISNNKREE